MTLTPGQKKTVLETLSDNIRSETGTELSTCCGETEATIGAVQRFMEEVAEWMVHAHPSQRYTI